MTKPVREFSANEGDNSVGLAGPDAIEGDLDTIMRMFDPLTTHGDGSPGGIGPENIQDGAGTDNMIGDKTINQAITDEYSNTGRLTKLLSWLAKTIKALKGTANWYDNPADSMNNMDIRISTNQQSISNNANSLSLHKNGTDHDARYYTKTQLVEGQLDGRYYTEVELNSGQLDGRYYTKDELIQWLNGGDTIVREDVFTIVSSDNGDGTFTYSHNGLEIIGLLGGSGEQIFTLISGVYTVGTNVIEGVINDTLRRSAASGGIQEISPTQVALTSPEGIGAEITFKYYERIAISTEYNIKMSPDKPPLNNGKTMWFKELT